MAAFCNVSCADAFPQGGVDLVGIGTLIAACGTLVCSFVQILISARKADAKEQPYLGYLAPRPSMPLSRSPSAAKPVPNDDVPSTPR